MGNFIIVAILLICVFLGVRSSMKHFKGEGGCCGGGSVPKEKKKKLNHVIGEKTVKIQGMHCENCKNSVERALNGIDGVAANVNLKKNLAVVKMEQEVPDREIQRAVEAAGFEVIEIL